MTSADARFMAMQMHLLGKTEYVLWWRRLAHELQKLENDGLRSYQPKKGDRFAVNAFTDRSNGEDSSEVQQRGVADTVAPL